jgi:hypothetical protein
MGAFTGAFHKLHRSSEHIEEFGRAFRGFLQSNTNTITKHRDARGRHYFEYPFGSGELPENLSLIAGDAIHNLRSALDHLAYAVASQPTRMKVTARDLRSINFPIYESRQAFRDRHSATKRIHEHVGADWERFILSKQPYQRRGDRNLLRISRLDNVDKHRLLLRLLPYVDVGLWGPIGPGVETRRLVVQVKNNKIRVPALHHNATFGPCVAFADALKTNERAPVDFQLRKFHASVASVYRDVAVRFFGSP